MSTVRTAAFYTQPSPSPSAAPTPADDTLTRAIDAIGERHGYVAREAPAVRKKRWTPVTEPLDQLSMRVAVSDINAFVALADKRAETFRETFAYLIKLAAAQASDAPAQR
jgi:hypothetical protein